MTMLLDYFSDWSIYKSLESLALVLGLIQLVLSYFNKVSLYLFGILSTAIYIYLFALPENALYAEAGLNAYYVIMSIYGWILWTRGGDNEEELPISSANAKEWKISLGILFTSFIFIVIILKTFTQTDVPIWDAAIASVAWAGTWLLTKRKLEYWILINISNAIAIPLMFYKSLYPTMLLLSIQFVVAILAYFKWKKDMLNTA